MESDSPDDTLLGDVFNPQAFLSSYTYLSIAAAKRLFGQLSMPNIWFASQVFSDSITVGSTGGFSVSTSGHVTMINGQITDEIPIETNDQSIPTTAFCHELRDDIFVGDHTWTGVNVFEGDTHGQTQQQNVTHESTLIANIKFVWDSISTLLSQANTWAMLQTFSSGLLATSATITGLFTSNSMTTNTLTINTSATTPNVSQGNTPDTSIANTSYVWSSLATFLTQQHTWTQTQSFADISSTNINGNNIAGNIIVGNAVISNGALTCVDLTSSNSISANSALFNTSCRVPNVSLITPPGNFAANTQYITDVIAQFLCQSHTWPLDQYFPGITAQSVACSTATVAGNLVCVGNISASNCNVTSNISAASVTCVSLAASGNIAANNISATNQMSANALVSNICTIAGALTGNTCTLSGALTCDTLRSSAAANLTITPSTGHHTVISSGNLSVSAGNINMHGGLYCDNTVSGLVFTGTTLIIDNITSPNDINLNGNFYAANTYGIQHRLLTVAYMINGSSPNTMYPLICSITNFVNDSDDSWIVAPGYHLYLYSGTSYSGFLGELDNTGGFQPLHASSTSIYGSINSVSSVKVYYHLTQITITGIS